jgi:hypothetical protein
MTLTPESHHEQLATATQGSPDESSRLFVPLLGSESQLPRMQDGRSSSEEVLTERRVKKQYLSAMLLSYQL